MRVAHLAIAAALTLATPALAGTCCHPVGFVYGVPPFVPVAPFYVVDQGPDLTGPGIYAFHVAEPTPPWAYAGPFPYIRRTGAPRWYYWFRRARYGR
jgi:hypothetical protein